MEFEYKQRPPAAARPTPPEGNEKSKQHLLERARQSAELDKLSPRERIKKEIIDRYIEERNALPPDDDNSWERVNLAKGYAAVFEFIKKNDAELLNKSPENWFPRKWMTDPATNKINAVIKQNPHLIPLLNFIHNRNKHLKGDDYRELIEINRRLLGEDLGEREFSTFITNKVFYAAAAKHLGVGTALVHKYIEEINRTGLLMRAKSGLYWVYVDGYFVMTAGIGRVKKSFITAEKKSALRSFKVRLNKKQQ